MSGHYIQKNRDRGFTLLELLAVLLLIGLIMAVALPRTTLTREQAFPVMLRELFREEALKAAADGKEKKIDFKKDGIIINEETHPYPDGISPDRDFVIEFTEAGFARPTKLIFHQKNGKHLYKVGLLGIYTEDEGKKRQ